MKPLVIAVLLLAVGGCGVVQSQDPRPAVIHARNFSAHPFMMHSRETPLPFVRGRGTDSLLAPCTSRQGTHRLRPPFDVRVGPGGPEDTGDGGGLPVLLTDADFTDPDMAWIITVEADGEVTTERVSVAEADAAVVDVLC